MVVTSVRITNAASTLAAAIIDGQEWSGIPCHIDGAALVIGGDDAVATSASAYLANGGAWTTYSATLPTNGDVDAERDRRLATFAFGGVVYDFDEVSRALIDKARVSAMNYIIVAGPQPGNLRWADATQDFGWIAADNTFHVMDAETCLSFGTAAASWEGRHILAARAIKNLSPIPADYAADARWP